MENEKHSNNEETLNGMGGMNPEEKVCSAKEEAMTSEAETEKVDKAILEDFDNRISLLEAQLEDKKAELLRARADFENSRRRLERDKDTFVRYGLENILKDMLPCLDSFEQAVISPSDEDSLEKLQEGVLLVKKQLVEILAKHGLTKVESDGATFNPELHQAIRKEESDEVCEEKVGEVYQHGFMLHDRLLRPAMVSVKMPKS